MKKVESIIRMSRLEQVKEALKASGVDGITITSVGCIGQEQGPTITYRGTRRTFDVVPKVKIELVVDDSHIEDVVEAIYENAHTGKPGDGEILVLDLASVTRIRTGVTVKAVPEYAY